MHHNKPTANERYYAKQASDFALRDKSCKFKTMTRADFKRYENLFQYHGIREVRTVYGLHKGARGVLLQCPMWQYDCWIIFED